MNQEQADAIFGRYLKHHARCDLEEVLRLFDEDAFVEDPVGAEVHRGEAARRAFYSGTQTRNGPLEFERVGPSLFGRSELTAHVLAGITRPGSPPPMDVIYVLEFSPAGKIASLRAWY